jgi:hypothetical protein
VVLADDPANPVHMAQQAASAANAIVGPPPVGWVVIRWDGTWTRKG